MNQKATKFTIGLLLVVIAGVFGYWVHSLTETDSDKPSSIEQTLAELHEKDEETEEEEVEHRIEMKKARKEYFFRLLRDPATNTIPRDIRARELNHAKKIPTFIQLKQRRKGQNSVAEGFNWQLAGPPATGGRTRALGIDQRNPETVIAGGISGGIWKSTNGGDSWDLKTPNAESFSVTSLAQDPTSPDTWYYASGEFIGNSASAPGASYYGTGIFKSSNNGETWNQIPSTADEDTQFNSQFDFISRIIVSPTSGTVFISSNGLGIFRSPDGSDFEDLTLGGFGEHLYADVAVASDGRLAGVLSSVSAGQDGGNPGIFISDNDGQNWTDVTPTSFPDSYNRSVLSFAPSNPDILYVFTLKNNDDSNQGVSFYKINLSDDPAIANDRAANLPDFGGSVGSLNLQGGYNMTISVNPEDPDLVTLGGTNLYRSFDGFATAPDGNTDPVKDEYWIGGYSKANNVSSYPNQHADQHIQIYDPNDSDRLWVGHDGGLSVTDDVTANSVEWIDRNDGYIVTQFYDASIPEEDSEDATGQKNIRLMGGTQDNGTPFFRFDGPAINPPDAFDISSGDGGYSFFTENYIFVSNQNGIVRRWATDSQGDISSPFAFVNPSLASDQLFINPYTIDPNDETIMYYTGGSVLWRNTEIDNITNNNSDGATTGWEQLTEAELSPSFTISALAVSQQPADILYFAGSDVSQSAQAPVIKRIENASTSNEAPVDISMPDAPEGAYVKDIAINPADANDVLVVMSNYSIVGLYHTSDGGENWNAVEGNLTGTNTPTSDSPGPSLRSATIIPAESGPIYVLATSTGIYATQELDGTNTEWGHEAENLIGYSVSEDITSRISDGDIAVGSHGRGMFVGRFQGEVVIASLPRIFLNINEGRAGSEITITASNFEFSTTASENDIYFGEIRADVIEASPREVTVLIPRAILAPNADDPTVFVTVELEEGTDPQPQPFTILPPITNSMGQNFPNPFNAEQNTKIPISLQRMSDVTIAIYDISGRLIDYPLKNEKYQPGTYNIPVNLSGRASGIYIYRIIAKPASSGAESFVKSEKLTFIK